jgi:hypothetical protein
MNIKMPFYLLPVMLVAYSFIPQLYYPLWIVLSIHILGAVILASIELDKLWRYGLGRYPNGVLVWTDWFKRFVVGFSLYYFTTYHVFSGVLGQVLFSTLYLTLMLYVLIVLNFKQH